MKRDHRILAELMGQGANLSVPRVIVRACQGDHSASMVLSQLVFWSSKTTRQDGFFYKTNEELANELEITAPKVRYHIKKLKTLLPGVLETKVKRANGAPTTHFKIDFEALIPVIESVMTKCSIRNEHLVNSNCSNDQIHGNEQMINSITDPNHTRTADPISLVQSKPSLPAEQVAASLVLKDKTLHVVTTDERDALQSAYPNVNVNAELQRMTAWIEANPAKRKTKAGIKRFIKAWLSRADKPQSRSTGGLSAQERIEAQNKSAVSEWLASKQGNTYDHEPNDQ